jgi:hypothetical protein
MQSRRSSKAHEIVGDGFGHETNVETGDVEKTRFLNTFRKAGMPAS